MDIIERKHKDVHYQMKQRCENPNHKKYPNYGGRGITVTERWKGLNGYNNFINDMGYRPTDKHSIDRIDVNGIYEKDNCRWATNKEQSMNRTVSSTVTTGDVFGKLTVVKELTPIIRPDGRDRRMFQLQCQCGNVIDGRMDKLNEGRLKSCGQKSCNKYYNKTPVIKIQ